MYEKFAHIYTAIKRQKENDKRVAVTKVCYLGKDNPKETIDRLKAEVKGISGKWRIYRSVNVRDVNSASFELANILTGRLVFPHNYTDKKVESLWPSLLANPRNKKTRYFLLDVDIQCQDYFTELLDILESEKISIREHCETPNGFHLITEPFNPTLVVDEHIEIKKDALYFIEAWEQ